MKWLPKGTSLPRMVWWYWLVLGLVLLGLELAAPGGLMALFFGIGALIVGMLALVGAAGPTWVQWLLFSVFSILSLAFLRKPLQARFNSGGRPGAVDALEEESAIVTEEIRAGEVGKVELRGASWTARCDGATLPRGQRTRVVRREGLTLWVRSE